ncbi:MAG: phosphohistidine phosphatase SixA [Anaerolineales bacterium]
MNLYIIRHAIAVEENPSISDSQRALTEKGRKKMRQIAKGLRILGVEFDMILSSPYIRAQETAEVLNDVFKMKKQLAFSDHLIPTGDPSALVAEIKEKYIVNDLAIVGHQPLLTNFISLLTANGAPVNVELKKGGVCRLATDDMHTATMQWLLTPGVLVEISEE